MPTVCELRVEAKNRNIKRTTKFRKTELEKGLKKSNKKDDLKKKSR